ncbi:MAG: hypothetical protein H8E72_09215 [Candidatus Marinimicrobia bacterium]|nr:hypothetical protein [Candidatus Neomarinimicrobiota bacterium]
MGDVNYAYDNFCEAVDRMAAHSGNIRERLHVAFIIFSSVKEDDFPDELKPDYCWIKEKLTKKEPIFHEGRVKATLYGMRTKTAIKIANRIVYLKNRLKASVG